MQQAAVPARDPGDQAPAPNRFGAWWASSSDRRFWVLLLGLNLLFSVAWALAKLSTFPRVPTPYPTVAAHLVRAYAREAAPNMVAGAAALAFVLACHRTEVRGRRAWVSFIASPVALFLPPVLLVLLGWLAGTLLHGLDAGRGWYHLWFRFSLEVWIFSLVATGVRVLGLALALRVFLQWARRRPLAVNLLAAALLASALDLPLQQPLTAALIPRLGDPLERSEIVARRTASEEQNCPLEAVTVSCRDRAITEGETFFPIYFRDFRARGAASWNLSWRGHTDCRVSACDRKLSYGCEIRIRGWLVPMAPYYFTQPTCEEQDLLPSSLPP